MFLLTVFAACLVAANAFVLPDVPRLDGKIVGGTVAEITEAPYQVALMIQYTLGYTFVYCGGSIIASDVVVTAASCITAIIRPFQSAVRAGSDFHNTGGQLIRISRTVKHPDFNSDLDNDISLVFLESSLVLSSSVAIVTLPLQGQTVADGANALVTGWGILAEGGTLPDELHKVTIPIVNQQQCVNAYHDFHTVTSNMICAGRLATGGADACDGDKGGPLTVGGILIGITSWGRGCARVGSPGVWTRVPNFVTWIKANM